jgi:hypothetical protein
MKTPEFDYAAFQNRLASISDVSDRELALLEDTVKFYNSNNRAVKRIGSDSKCVYYATATSPGCAIGRCMDRNFVYDGMADIKAVIDSTYPLPPWLLAMDHHFLNSLQGLHDNDPYWNDVGLSAAGLLYLANIKRNIEQRREQRAQNNC